MAAPGDKKKGEREIQDRAKSIWILILGITMEMAEGFNSITKWSVDDDKNFGEFGFPLQ